MKTYRYLIVIFLFLCLGISGANANAAAANSAKEDIKSLLKIMYPKIFKAHSAHSLDSVDSKNSYARDFVADSKDYLDSKNTESKSAIDKINKDIPPKVLQKLADKPRDMRINAIASDGYLYCYQPTFTAGESYVMLDYCYHAPRARYDIFRRISFNVNGTWLCLSAPYSVLNKRETWDYLRLRPCAINDPAQIWDYKNNAFYTRVGDYRIKDYKYYLYISRRPHDYNDHSLASNMISWANTKARPHSMNIKTTIGWYYQDKKSFVGKDIKGSSENPVYFFYNPENKHLFVYNQVEGVFECVHSNSSPGSSWEWTYMDICKDSDTIDNIKWDLVYQADLSSSFLDHNRHFLRATRYGPNWGTLYTASGDFIKSDTTNSPTSYFVLDSFFRKYYRFIGGNLSNNLEYCPAPGFAIKSKDSKRDKSAIFPTDFVFDDDWLRLLYSIGISTDFQRSEEISVGACGICFLQTMEIVYQLIEGYPELPVTPHLFAYNPNRDPFISFQQRYPDLYREYQYFAYVQGFPLIEGEDIYDRTLRVSRGTLAMTLGRYDFIYSGLMRNPGDIDREIRRMLISPHGSIFMVVTFRRDSEGQLGAHIQPVVSTSRGLVIIPVNLADIDYEVFLDAMHPATDLASARELLEDSHSIEILGTLQVTPQNPFEGNLSALLSFFDCSGNGAGARGTLMPINSALLNQCESGFCQ